MRGVVTEPLGNGFIAYEGEIEEIGPHRRAALLEELRERARAARAASKAARVAPAGR